MRKAHHFSDPRPRNGQGQFAAQDTGGMDPMSMSVAYDPRIIQARKRALSQKVVSMFRGNKAVETSVPPQGGNQFSFRQRLRELAVKCFQLQGGKVFNSPRS